MLIKVEVTNEYSGLTCKKTILYFWHSEFWVFCGSVIFSLFRKNRKAMSHSYNEFFVTDFRIHDRLDRVDIIFVNQLAYQRRYKQQICSAVSLHNLQQYGNPKYWSYSLDRGWGGGAGEKVIRKPDTVLFALKWIVRKSLLMSHLTDCFVTSAPSNLSRSQKGATLQLFAKMWRRLTV